MKHNMGKLDRVVRAAAGVVLGYLVVSKTVGGVLAVILGVFAAALILTALVGYCPPYQVLGISTCRSCEEHGGKGTARG